MQEPVWWRRPKRLVALAMVVGGVIILVAGWVWPSAAQPVSEADVGLLSSSDTQNNSLDMPATAPTSATTPTPASAIVYVTGAVAQPDVYILPHDARVKDAVVAAGGLMEDAASDQINLAAPIQDAQHIHIPRVGETVTPATAAGGERPGSESSRQVNINIASAADLEDLPGIGQTLAERIITHREANGPFASVDDLRKVAGVGAKVFEDIRPLITVGN